MLPLANYLTLSTVQYTNIIPRYILLIDELMMPSKLAKDALLQVGPAQDIYQLQSKDRPNIQSSDLGINITLRMPNNLTINHNP